MATKRPPRPQTPLAKADAALTRDHRKLYPNFDHDAAAFGRRVADFNAGFIAGGNDAKRKRKP